MVGGGDGRLGCKICPMLTMSFQHLNIPDLSPDVSVLHILAEWSITSSTNCPQNPNHLLKVLAFVPFVSNNLRRMLISTIRTLVKKPKEEIYYSKVLHLTFEGMFYLFFQ